MITVIHGDNLEASRTALLGHRRSRPSSEIRMLEGTNVTPETIRLAGTSMSLFGGDILLVVENFFARNAKQRKLVATSVEVLRQLDGSIDIILWEPKKLTPAQLKSLGTIREEVYQLPLVLFQFLDSCQPRSGRPALTLLEQTLSRNPPELVFAMLLRRVRQLLFLKLHVPGDAMSPWQQSRLTSQSNFFTMEKLASWLVRLGRIESDWKSGSTLIPLSTNIRLACIEYLL